MRLSAELTKCRQWLVDNRLSLHLGKTECLLFGTKSKLKKVADFKVFCEGIAIQRVSHVKYLGVQLDANLDGSTHVGGLLKTCMGRLAFLYRNSGLLDIILVECCVRLSSNLTWIIVRPHGIAA